jgi:chromate transporter
MSPSQLQAPKSPADLFLSFTVLALQGFGGVLSVAQRELVERKRWMSEEEFLEEWAVAQIMPGPNVINLALMLGHRYFGLRGALAAVGGMLALPSLVVLGAATAYAHYAGNPQLVGALRGMAAVAAGMIAATGVKMLPSLARHALPLWITAPLVAAGVAAGAWLRLPLLPTLLVIGGLGCWLTYRRLP